MINPFLTNFSKKKKKKKKTMLLYLVYVILSYTVRRHKAFGYPGWSLGAKSNFFFLRPTT